MSSDSPFVRPIGDYKVKAWRKSGLLYPSTVTGIIRTIKQDMIVGKLGELPAAELRTVDERLREVLEISPVGGGA